VFTGIEYAVKIIEKRPGLYCRSKVLKEIEIYHLCQGHQNIIQLIEYFEEADFFYLVFEKIKGGPLLNHIQQRVCFTEMEASTIIKSLAEALKHLHKQGIAHRDVKPDNILCVNDDTPCPVKLCDFDLCSNVNMEASTPRLLTPVGSVEYMAPEVVDTFLVDEYYDEELSYDKKCDLWSLGIIMYILLCGYVPFSGQCGSNCGWEKGNNCTSCQELLFDSIKEGQVEFHDRHWADISDEAKDLICHLLEKDSRLRFDTAQLLEHPWIVNGGCNISLHTPQNLKRQASLKDLENFVSRALSANQSVDLHYKGSQQAVSSPVDVPKRVANPFLMDTLNHVKPWRRETWSFDLSPPSESTCSLLQRRRKSKYFLEKNRFCSIDELELESLDSDHFMKAI
jgi:MAP kinase interacting serine/threonine kinase